MHEARVGIVSNGDTAELWPLLYSLVKPDHTPEHDLLDTLRCYGNSETWPDRSCPSNRNCKQTDATMGYKYNNNMGW